MAHVIGSIQNGTVRDGKILATLKNRLYLCSAFETSSILIFDCYE